MNLFGGTVVGLGSKQHEKYYDDFDSGNLIGCFCLTELSYGNNAVEMETTAIWNQDNKTFTINTPTVSSQKYWITNGAYHANMSVVFAQTIVNGKNEGINAFLVPLRDEKGNVLPNIVIDDIGVKLGMNGVDNARIIYRNITIKKENMLNNLNDISEEGNFVSNIKNRRERFLAAANRLLSGRLCIASMAMAGTKKTLLITNKYASDRLSNGKTGKSDTPIADFQLFQNQIVPLIARTIVLNLGLLNIRKIYSAYIINQKEYNKAQINEITRLCCVIKPLVAWNANLTGKNIKL